MNPKYPIFPKFPKFKSREDRKKEIEKQAKEQGINFKFDKNSKCPFESEDLAGQVKFNEAVEEWNRKYGTEYDSIITYLKEEKGLKKERKTITHKDIEFVTTHPLKKDCSGTIITIKLPEEYELGMYMGYDLERISHTEAHGFRIKAADALNKELGGYTNIRVSIYNSETCYFQSCLPSPFYIPYENICRTDELFKFNKHNSINKNQQQNYEVVYSNIDIENIEYLGTWDFWK